MILSLLIAWAEPEVAPTDEVHPDDTLSEFRAPLKLLAERVIGTASKPVAFNWRRSKFQLAATGSLLYELNNFNSMRGGLMVRAPIGAALFEFNVSYVGVWDTPASRLLSLTPYRQPGRPPRLEADITLAFPFAEGVITALPSFMPALQNVFNGYASFTYMVYPTGWGGLRPGQVGAAIFSPTITDREIRNLDTARLDSMQIDKGRYGLMLGLGNDVYSKSGFFVSPRLMVAIPILAPVTNTQLRFWAEFNLAIGQAF